MSMNRPLDDRDQLARLTVRIAELEGQVAAVRALGEEYAERVAQAERLVKANSEKHAVASRGGLENQEQITALRTHGWQLDGRLDALRYADERLRAALDPDPADRGTGEGAS